MIAEYTVKRNGKWYKAGEFIPEAEVSASGINPEKFRKTKTEINMMKVDDLRALAKKYGIENADSMTGSAIKEHFVKIFDL
jgi:hypothetical protein